MDQTQKNCLPDSSNDHLNPQSNEKKTNDEDILEIDYTQIKKFYTPMSEKFRKIEHDTEFKLEQEEIQNQLLKYNNVSSNLKSIIDNIDSKQQTLGSELNISEYEFAKTWGPNNQNQSKFRRQRHQHKSQILSNNQQISDKESLISNFSREKVSQSLKITNKYDDICQKNGTPDNFINISLEEIQISKTIKTADCKDQMNEITQNSSIKGSDFFPSRQEKVQDQLNEQKISSGEKNFKANSIKNMSIMLVTEVKIQNFKNEKMEFQGSQKQIKQNLGNSSIKSRYSQKINMSTEIQIDDLNAKESEITQEFKQEQQVQIPIIQVNDGNNLDYNISDKKEQKNQLLELPPRTQNKENIQTICLKPVEIIATISNKKLSKKLSITSNALYLLLQTKPIDPQQEYSKIISFCQDWLLKNHIKTYFQKQQFVKILEKYFFVFGLDLLPRNPNCQNENQFSISKNLLQDGVFCCAYINIITELKYCSEESKLLTQYMLYSEYNKKIMTSKDFFKQKYQNIKTLRLEQMNKLVREKFDQIYKKKQSTKKKRSKIEQKSQKIETKIEKQAQQIQIDQPKEQKISHQSKNNDEKPQISSRKLRSSIHKMQVEIKQKGTQIKLQQPSIKKEQPKVQQPQSVQMQVEKEPIQMEIEKEIEKEIEFLEPLPSHIDIPVQSLLDLTRSIKQQKIEYSVKKLNEDFFEQNLLDLINDIDNQQVSKPQPQDQFLLQPLQQKLDIKNSIISSTNSLSSMQTITLSANSQVIKKLVEPQLQQETIAVSNKIDIKQNDKVKGKKQSKKEIKRVTKKRGRSKNTIEIIRETQQKQEKETDLDDTQGIIDSKPQPNSKLLMSKNSKQLNFNQKDRFMYSQKDNKFLNSHQDSKFLNSSKDSKFLNSQRDLKFLNSSKDSKFLNSQKDLKFLQSQKNSKHLQSHNSKFLHPQTSSKFLYSRTDSKFLNSQQDLRYLNSQRASKFGHLQKDSKSLNSERQSSNSLSIKPCSKFEKKLQETIKPQGLLQSKITASQQSSEHKPSNFLRAGDGLRHRSKESKTLVSSKILPTRQLRSKK